MPVRHDSRRVADPQDVIGTWTDESASVYTIARYQGLFPGAVAMPGAAATAHNRFGFGAIDHVTSNSQTMKPALLWMEHVLGLEQLWQVDFHASDVEPDRQTGSGLRSIGMWDPVSAVKFANNEPARPFFKSSQINR